MTSARDPVSVMTAGAAILAGELSPAEFTVELTRHGRSSGGNFATGPVHPGRSVPGNPLPLFAGTDHLRVGGSRLSHADYLAGLGQAGAYPGYDTDPLNGFRHLACRYQASATAIAAGMTAASRQPGSRAAGRFRDARFRQPPWTSISSSRTCGRHP